MGRGNKDETEDDNITVKSADKAAKAVTKKDLQPEKAERDRGTLYGRRSLRRSPKKSPGRGSYSRSAAGSAVGIGYSTRGQSSSKVGEGMQVTAV